MPSRARLYEGSTPMSRPSHVIRPDRRGRSPMMLSMVVVLPAPLRPTRQTHSFSPSLSETWRRIWARPRYVSTLVSSSMAGPENELSDLLVLLDLFQNAAGQDEALVHDHDAV